MSDFVKAMLFTAVPILALGVLAVITSHVGSSSSLYAYVWIAAGLYLGCAFVTGIVFGIRRKMKITAGIFVGMAIGVVAMGASCFASIFTSNL